MKHWYEVKRYINGVYDPIVTYHRTKAETLKAVRKAEKTGKYDVVVWDEYDEDGIVD